MQALRTNEQQLKQMVALIHKLQQNRATPMGNISFSWTLDERPCHQLEHGGRHRRPRVHGLR